MTAIGVGDAGTPLERIAGDTTCAARGRSRRFSSHFITECTYSSTFQHTDFQQLPISPPSVQPLDPAPEALSRRELSGIPHHLAHLNILA
jgi:hypothetical protein